ncbi:hypothetical protein T08_15620 [Trichinella sp. T8]|nr:hypothetical protein T08_15620 [Trichinella sp. T8]
MENQFTGSMWTTKIVEPVNLHYFSKGGDGALCLSKTTRLLTHRKFGVEIAVAKSKPGTKKLLVALTIDHKKHNFTKKNWQDKCRMAKL